MGDNRSEFTNQVRKEFQMRGNRMSLPELHAVFSNRDVGFINNSIYGLAYRGVLKMNLDQDTGAKVYTLVSAEEREAGNSLPLPSAEDLIKTIGNEKLSAREILERMGYPVTQRYMQHIGNLAKRSNGPIHAVKNRSKDGHKVNTFAVGSKSTKRVTKPETAEAPTASEAPDTFSVGEILAAFNSINSQVVRLLKNYERIQEMLKSGL